MLFVSEETGKIEDFMQLPLSTDFLRAGTKTVMELLLFSKTFPAENEGLDGLFFWSMDFPEDSEAFELILAESLGVTKGETTISAFFGDVFRLGLCQIVSLSMAGITSISISLPS